MANSDTPESLLSFVEKHKSRLPAVVEIADGIYGSLEKDSEVRDFSRGDILRLLTVKEEVNMTFDSVYAGASKKGLITVDRHFNESQFEVLSPFNDGYVYKTLEQMMLDFPELVRAVKSDKNLDIQVGDRLRLLARSGHIGRQSIQCKNIRTGRTVKLSGDLKETYAKKIDKANYSTQSLNSIYHRLPQRVRFVRDEGQKIRGKSHSIPGLDPEFNGEMNLSRIDVVEACPWEYPDRIIQIPVTTDVFVYPRKDWGNKIGPVVDIHDLAKEASPNSMKVAVVVDEESIVPGCPKDTILLVCTSQTCDYVIAKDRCGTCVLIPKNYPSLFKVLGDTWKTVEDLLQVRMCQDVNVGTTYKAPKELDTLYQHDVVRLTSLQPESLNFGDDEVCEVLKMSRSRSLVGKVGSIIVPTFAKADFYQNSDLIADCVLSTILMQHLPLRVTLSQPCVSQKRELSDKNDDELMNMSPLEITDQRQIKVTVCQLLSTNQQSSGDEDDVIYIPEFNKLNVRSVNRPTLDVQRRNKLPSLNTNIMRISERQLNISKEDTYELVSPLIPRRGDEHTTVHVQSSGKPPPRPHKSLTVIQYSQLNKGQETSALPPRSDNKETALPPRGDDKVPALPHRGDDKVPALPHRGYDKVPALPHRGDDKVPALPHRGYDKVPALPHRGDDKVPALPHRGDDKLPAVPHRGDNRVPALPPRQEQLPPTPSPTSKHTLSFLFPSRVKIPSFTGFRHREHGGNKAVTSPTSSLPDKRPLPPSPATENKYKTIGKESFQDESAVDYEVTLPTEKSADCDTDSDGANYERPGDGYEKPANRAMKTGVGPPPKVGNISAYGQSEMIQLLTSLKVSPRMVKTFKTKMIDGKTLCDLYRRCDDESLQRTLGVEDVKDWLALKCYIMTSISK